MIATLTAEYAGCYALTPVSQRERKALKNDTGHDCTFVQTDWDRPALARSLGWSGKIGRERCPHRSTDGTVTCRECGSTASDFIAAATDWLDRRDGCNFRVDSI